MNKESEGEGKMRQDKTCFSEQLLQDAALHPKVKRAFLFIEDEEWVKADEYLESALDESPTNAYAYLGKLMVEYKAKTVESLEQYSDSITENKWYVKALRFSDDRLSGVLKALNGSEEIVPAPKEDAAGEKPDTITPEEKKRKIIKLLLVLAPFILVLLIVAFHSSSGNSPSQTSKLEEAEAFLAKGNLRDAGAIMQQYGFSEDERAQKIWSRTTGRTTRARYSNGFDEYTLTVNADGSVSTSGKNTSGRLNVGNWSNIVAVAAGENHSVGLCADGTVVATGSNSYGQCNVQSWKNVVYIGADREFTIGFTADGKFLFTGRSSYALRGGTLTYDFGSSWTDLVRIVDGGGCFAGLKSDGTVVATGRNAEGQCEVGRWRNVIFISADYWYVSGKQEDGKTLTAGKK